MQIPELFPLLTFSCVFALLPFQRPTVSFKQDWSENNLFVTNVGTHNHVCSSATRKCVCAHMCVFKSKHSGVKSILLVDTGIEKDQYFNLRLKKKTLSQPLKWKSSLSGSKRWIDVPGFFFIPFVLSDQVIHWVFVGLEESKSIGMGNPAFSSFLSYSQQTHISTLTSTTTAPILLLSAFLIPSR